jgi:hypothetical protein
MGFLSQDDNKHSFKVTTNESEFKLEQDVSAYKDYAKESRDADELVSSKRQYRSFAIIPDVVAIDILTKYHLDVHSPELMSDPAQMRRLKNIIMTDYPLLLTSNMRNN